MDLISTRGRTEQPNLDDELFSERSQESNSSLISSHKDGYTPYNPEKLVAESRDNTPDHLGLKGELTEVSVIGTVSNIEGRVPYSRFYRADKFLLVIVCALGGFYSTIAQTIYIPALTSIEEQFHVTEEKVNITIVAYSIFQGIVPMFMGGLADKLGRRPVAMCCLAIYFVACIGLAVCKNYAEMVFLRCLQGAGISPIIAINGGIMGDVTVKAERGGYVGMTAGFQIIGSAFGGIIGASLSSTWNWRAIFWFLAIGSGATLVVVSIILPETKRSIVGNGSVRPKAFINKCLLLSLPRYRKQLCLDKPEYESLAEDSPFDFKTPIKILQKPELAPILFVQGLQNAIWICHLTTLTHVLSSRYGLSVQEIGYCFLPAGICNLLSNVVTGRILNRNYKRAYKKHTEWLKAEKVELMEKHGNDKKTVKNILETDLKYKFNLYSARLSFGLITVVVSNIFFIVYGWCIDTEQKLAIVLVFSGLASAFSNGIISTTNTILVDLHPNKSSTATGCVNFVRCSLVAIFIAVLENMNDAMTIGGTYTFMSCLSSVSSILFWIPIKYGVKWQTNRESREMRTQESPDEKEKMILDENHIDPNDPVQQEELSALRRAATVQSMSSAL